MSDNGNLFAFTKDPNTGIGFPPPPYFQGRFSNGLNWTDILAQKLNLKSPTPIATGGNLNSGINFAFGGATTTPINTIATGLPSLPQEIGTFKYLVSQNPQLADPNALYTVWFGANDYLPTQSLDFPPFTTPNTTLKNISDAILDLASVGAKNFVVANLPNLGDTPLALGIDSQFNGFSHQLNTLSQQHNLGLSQLIANLNQNPALGLNIKLLDVNPLFNNAKNLGFKTIDKPCLDRVAGTICANPDEYLFWDEIHPTARAHAILGAAAFSTVPEPSMTIGMLSFGALAAAGMLKRKQTRSKLTGRNLALTASKN
ncbi:hypothetical protein NSMS1_20800 [Nostoc sp. MS1]|nr:hypothetical protein NSMS1_20800 [Nostoc sp. MS1]